jgi:hypothetical protein
MEGIAEKLENKLHEWKPETSQKVRALVAEIIQPPSAAPCLTFVWTSLAGMGPGIAAVGALEAVCRVSMHWPQLGQANVCPGEKPSSSTCCPQFRQDWADENEGVLHRVL